MQLWPVTIAAVENLTNDEHLLAAEFRQFKMRWSGVSNQSNATLHVPTRLICDWLQITALKASHSLVAKLQKAGEIRVHFCEDANLHALQ